jgi:hypothetical protein
MIFLVETLLYWRSGTFCLFNFTVEFVLQTRRISRKTSVLTLIVLSTLLPQYGTLEIRTEIRIPLLKIEAGFRQPLTVSSALKFVKISFSSSPNFESKS